MINTLLVGFGFSAKTFHLPFLSELPEFCVTGVVSSKPDQVKAQLSDVSVWSSLNEALAEASFDLVVITTPNHLHVEQTEQALLANSHVLVEKPFTLSAEEAQRLVDLAAEQNRQLCVYHNRRFDGDFLTLQQLINNERIGKVKRLVSRFDRFRPHPRARWRELAGPGSGIFWDLGPHLIDQALQLFGPPEHVGGTVTQLRDNGESTDLFDITLVYADKLVQLGSTPFQAGPTLRYDLQGDEGSYRKYHLDPQEAQLISGLSIHEPAFGITQDAEHGMLYTAESAETVTTERGAYTAFYTQLANTIQAGTPLPADGQSVVNVIKVIELAEKAAEAGKVLVFN